MQRPKKAQISETLKIVKLPLTPVASNFEKLVASKFDSKLSWFKKKLVSALSSCKIGLKSNNLKKASALIFQWLYIIFNVLCQHS